MIKILFYGSSRFSLETLKALLLNKSFEVVAIITNEAKPTGRNYILQENIVTQTAIEMGFNQDLIFKVKNLKSDDLYTTIKKLNFDIGVVVAFGHIIPVRFLELSLIDTINLHPSSLPLFRGAAPIQRTIANNHDHIDICIIRVVEKLDEGDVIIRILQEISKEDHASDLIPTLSKKGSELMVDAINLIYQNKNNLLKIYSPQKGETSYAAKINSTELKINFDEDGLLIYNKIKAYNMDGCMYFIYKDQRLKILQASFERTDHIRPIGQVYFDKKTAKIAVKGGLIRLTKIQASGKKVMQAEDFFISLEN
jgi:methionyl-tRNA formyltransferase